jgi:hypothetical protein
MIRLWQTEADLKMPIGKIRKFHDAKRVREPIGRTSTSINVETLNIIEHSIGGGRGGMYPQRTGGQYHKRPASPAHLGHWAATNIYCSAARFFQLKTNPT